MDYEKLHNETLRNLKEMVSKGKITEKVAVGICADFVIESEDEKIRKEIISYVQQAIDSGYGIISERREEKWLAWLEKQDEKDEEILILKDQIESLHAAIKANKETHKIELEKLKEQKPVDMIQWTGDNLKDVIAFTGKSPNFDKWFKSQEEYENYVHAHNNIFKLFNEDGSHCEIPVGAWIVKTPDGYNVASKYRFVQKPVEWSEEDEKLYQSALWHIKNSCGNQGKTSGEYEVYHFVKSLKDRIQPQPKQEWSKEDEKTRSSIIDFIRYELNHHAYIGTAGVDSARQIEWLESLKDRVHPLTKQEWSEEDERHVNSLLKRLEGLCRNKFERTRFAINEDEDWLKSLRPQKKQEWTKEDIDMIDWLIRCCEKEHEELCNDKYGHQDIVSDLKRDCRKKWDWLESLKDKAVPQKQWKPTEMQLKCLKDACDEHFDLDGLDPLYTLYEQLKAL